MALKLTLMVISGLSVISTSTLIIFITSNKLFQQESTFVLSWGVSNKLDSKFLHLSIFSFGLNFISLLLVMQKGMEGKKGKGKAPHGRGRGKANDDDDESGPGGEPGRGGILI